MHQKPLIWLFLLFLPLTFACKQMPLVHDLSERDANEIVVMLAKNNIKAIKTKEIRNQEVFWSIATTPGDELAARSILVANNLPRIRQGGLEGICKDAGLILTPKTERCREILAYKGEIINSLESIPGVVSADVVLNLPEKPEFVDENIPQPRPTASVTIQYLADANVQTRLTEAKVQEFVANAVSGLDSRDVTVIISYFEQKLDPSIPINNLDPQGNKLTSTEKPIQGDVDVITIVTGDGTGDMVSVGGIVMDQESAKKFKIIAGVFLGGLFLLAAAFIFALFRMARLRRQNSAVSSETSPVPVDDNKMMEV